MVHTLYDSGRYTDKGYCKLLERHLKENHKYRQLHGGGAHLGFIWYERVVNSEYLLNALLVRVKPDIPIFQDKAVLCYGLAP